VLFEKALFHVFCVFIPQSTTQGPRPCEIIFWFFKVIRSHSRSFGVTRRHSKTLEVIRSHSKSLEVTRSHSKSLEVTRFFNFFVHGWENNPCRSERAETRVSDKMFQFFFDFFFLEQNFCTFFYFVILGGYRCLPLSRWVHATPRPSLICGPLECGLLSVTQKWGGKIWGEGIEGGRKCIETLIQKKRKASVSTLVGILENKLLRLFPAEFWTSKVTIRWSVLKDGSF